VAEIAANYLDRHESPVFHDESPETKQRCVHVAADVNSVCCNARNKTTHTHMHEVTCTGTVVKFRSIFWPEICHEIFGEIFREI